MSADNQASNSNECSENKSQHQYLYANSSQFQQPLSSSSPSATNVADFFNEGINDICLYMKKYSEFYQQSEQEEENNIAALDSFYNFIDDYQVHLNQKLKVHREKISKFSRILSSDSKGSRVMIGKPSSV